MIYNVLVYILSMKIIYMNFSPAPQITVLQLSTLLKQADSSKRKLTLTRLASAPVPFTVLSLTGNPCNEDYLAVCGLKVRNQVFTEKKTFKKPFYVVITFSFFFFLGLPCSNIQ